MARPTDADSAKTYDGIVSATLALLDELDGVDKVSMRRVAARAEVSLGTIQYYFETKDALLEACLDGYYRRLTTLANELLGLVRDPAFAGRRLVEHSARELYRWAWSERRLIELRRATTVKRGELHVDRQPEFMGSLIRQVADTLAPHIEIDPVETRFVIQLLATALVRCVLYTDSEITHLTDATGPEGRALVEQHFVAAACRLLRPSEG